MSGLIKYLLILPFSIFLLGCEERYRYPCQDPDNWEDKMCKKPYCSANGTCPEDLTHYERKNISYNEKGDPVYRPAPSSPSKGDCK